jgi:NAD(P)-dependent dehydrogenase (short-subunit alcohol dehydrogenase family)
MRVLRPVDGQLRRVASIEMYDRLRNDRVTAGSGSPTGIMSNLSWADGSGRLVQINPQRELGRENKMDLTQSRHAFITGGASGIGLAIGDALAKRGVRLTLADVDEAGLKSALAARSDHYRGQVLDTRDREGWARAKTEAEAEAAFGPVDILVNNAGIGPDGRPFADMEPASFDRIIAINLTGVFNGVAAFAADMRQRGRGHIVNTASTAGLTFSPPGAGAYTIAKHGVVSMSETLRREMAPHGVGVSVLCPGLVATNLPRTTARMSGDGRDADASMPPSSIDPAVVGELVAKAIEADLPYVVTHPEYWPAVEQRLSAIETAYRSAGR